METDRSILTICLLTRGRDAFLPECLASLEQFAKDSDVRFLVVNNGAGEYSSKLLFEFIQRDVAHRQLIVRETNDTVYSSFWNILSELKLGWVLLPSDDDILLPNAVDVWRQQLLTNPELVAIGASARVIAGNSRKSGASLYPTNLDSRNPIQKLANCFYEPPFIWPALYIFVPAAPKDTCHSRYAFDWWISLNLLTSKAVSTTKEIILNYRIHDGQDSNVASRRRKYFEAAVWQSRFATSEVFRKWVIRSTAPDVLYFWKALLKKSPVYGSEEFGNLVLFNISEVLTSEVQDREVVGVIIADVAARFNIFLKNNEGRHMSNRREITNWEANIYFITESDVCKEVSEAAMEFTRKDAEINFYISCRHSSNKGTDIKIDCLKFFPFNPKLNADVMVQNVTEWCEYNGSIETALSNGERILVRLYRDFYSKFPSTLINAAKKFKQRVQA